MKIQVWGTQCRNYGFINLWLNETIEWLALILRTLEITESGLGQKDRVLTKPFRGISQSLPAKCCGSILN
jgi:hypothetical protein